MRASSLTFTRQNCFLDDYKWPNLKIVIRIRKPFWLDKLRKKKKHGKKKSIIEPLALILTVK